MRHGITVASMPRPGVGNSRRGVVVTEEAAGRTAEAGEADEFDDQHPKGAFVLTLAFIVVLVAAWAFTYATLIGRG